jgi:hypothetical protein
MSDRNNSADFGPLVSRSAARSAFRNALRLYVGRGRRYSVKQLSNGTGVKDRVIECAMADPDNGEYREPELAAVLSISAFLGSAFTTEWLKEAGQGAFDLPGGEDLPPGQLAADNADDNAVVTRAALDGVFDPDERRQLRPVGLRMVARGHRLAALVA